MLLLSHDFFPYTSLTFPIRVCMGLDMHFIPPSPDMATGADVFPMHP